MPVMLVRTSAGIVNRSKSVRIRLRAPLVPRKHRWRCYRPVSDGERFKSAAGLHYSGRDTAVFPLGVPSGSDALLVQHRTWKVRALGNEVGSIPNGSAMESTSDPEGPRRLRTPHVRARASSLILGLSSTWKASGTDEDSGLNPPAPQGVVSSILTPSAKWSCSSTAEHRPVTAEVARSALVGIATR